MEDLNLGIATADPPSNVSLTDLQRSLGKAVAAIVWYGKWHFAIVDPNRPKSYIHYITDRNKNHSSVFSYVNSTNPLDPPVNENRTGEATVEVSVIRLRLNVSILNVV